MIRRRSAAALAVAVSLLFASLGSVAVGAADAPPDIAVYPDGQYMLVRFTTDGETLQRYSGFGRISDVTRYDDSTVLVAELERDRISAMDLDGRILWTLSVRRPTCVEVLGPDRFLVCHDDPAGVTETDRAGTVYWKLTNPLREATGAVRLADGNTAVVEGRGPHAVHVFTPAGKIVWSGTESLAQPRGLALLPSGELATAGFDSGRGVIFQPYTTNLRVFEYSGHGEDLSVTAQGDLLTFSPEAQIIRLWKGGKRIAWEFKTLYPAYHGVMLDDGTVLASIHHMPDRVCPNAATKARIDAEPRPDYWRWMLMALGFAVAAIALFQFRALRSYVPMLASAATPAPPDSNDQNEPVLTRGRRLEIGAYVVVIVALAVTAAVILPRLPYDDWNTFWIYCGLTITAGVLLALLQARTPPEPNDWRERMATAAPMPWPRWPMWLLWTVALLLLGGAAYYIVHEEAGLGAGLWTAGLITLLGGSLETARRRPELHRRGLLLGLAIVVVVALPRLYRLEVYPPNLHLDMAQWSVQVLELLDTRPQTLFTNGWADIPMVGYLWSALWAAIAGRSLAGVRLAAAMGGILAIVAAFFIARRLYNLRTALILTAFLAVNHGFVHFSRIQAYMDPIPFQVLAIMSLLAGLDSGRYGWFALAGLSGGFSALSYHAGRITPPLLLLLLALTLLWYPRTLLRRWKGLVIFSFALAAMLIPQAIVYYYGRANPFGRGNMFAWVHDGQLDFAVLGQTLAHGVPMVMGTFWFFRDAASQYAAPGPAFFSPMATLLGMTVFAIVLRPRDLRGVWTWLWCFTILMVGGVLTIDQPFWPRMFGAFVPAVLICAIAVDALWRGARVAGGRVGGALATVAVGAVVLLTAWQQLDFYRDYCVGIPPGGTKPTLRTEWTQSIMGRDVERWGADALIYIVAANPIDQSCEHPTMAFYDYAVDAHDARLISDYLPFQDPRTIVTYFLPESADQVEVIRQRYPDAEITTFPDNLGRPVFTRAVVGATSPSQRAGVGQMAPASK